ncbi:ABC transporter permease subunit [Roseibium porphyridii]|uniref:ABC transporter permease subunit n=1 Tax=Roseibium porphyridii TaxID=2866279 RepID=A0ABY8F0Q1_9HYPH|nr:ABC transporter permease subunit [Roseibium sp. KMA01]WFE88309.1 ABC transporter permease subunit [Roseibium sp. KMA01]
MSSRKVDTEVSGSISIRLISLGLLLVGWTAFAAAIADPAILPSPFEVGGLTFSELTNGPLLYHLGITLARVLAAFVLAMTIGTVFGLIMGRRKAVDTWLDPWLLFFLNLPALVTIVLCYLWIGLTEVAAIAAVAINKIPMVTVLIREGARTFDPALDDMSKIFRVSRLTRFRHITVPQLAPFFAASARTGTALIWKIVLVVEFLGRSNGVGFQIHLYFQLFDVAMVLTYALAFIIVMLLIEFAVLQPWERRASRWRRA